jgi:hypothetical protein
MPPPIPMSSVSPSLDRPLLVSPVSARVVGAGATPSEAALKPPGFVARLRASRPSVAWLLIGGLVVLVAFGGGLLTGRLLAPAQAARVTDAEPEKRGKKGATDPPPAEPLPAAAPAPPTPAPASKPGEGGGGTKRAFNSKAAKTAVDRAAARTKSCRNSRDPAGSVSATVTFAPSGKVSDVTITTPGYAGTKTGACIESLLRQARVPEFSGNPVTVKKSLVIR